MSLSSVKRALIEMVQFGALSRQDGGWFSCNQTRFYDCTVMALLSKQLAIYSINEKLPGRQFVRLNEAGIALARAIVAELNGRKQANEAAERLQAEIMRLTPTSWVVEKVT
jgi:hypothetical protein